MHIFRHFEIKTDIETMVVQLYSSRARRSLRIEWMDGSSPACSPAHASDFIRKLERIWPLSKGVVKAFVEGTAQPIP